jgi:hypothetical protein
MRLSRDERVRQIFRAYLEAEWDCGMDQRQFQSDVQTQTPLSVRRHPSESVYQIAIIVAALLLVITASLF